LIPLTVFSVQGNTVKDKKTANSLFVRKQGFTATFHLVLCAPFTATSIGQMQAVKRVKQFEIHEFRGGVPERPKGADCKSAVIDFEGSSRAKRDSVATQRPEGRGLRPSNPSPTTILLYFL